MNTLVTCALIGLLASMTAAACSRALNHARGRLEASAGLHEARMVLLLVSLDSPELAAAVDPAWERLLR